MTVFRFAIAALLAVVAAQPATAQDDGLSAYALSSKGDPREGRRVFFKCKACHKLTADARPLIGPNLDALFGRRVGTSPGYDRYSSALLNADFIWTEQRLDEWLRKPNSFLPGNKMSFAGLRKEQDRRDLIAYLRQAAGARD